MASSDYPYVAVREIFYNGVRAYNAGDNVAPSAVDGADSWLAIGEDVAVRPGYKPDKPCPDSSQGQWAAYAVSQGADADKAANLSRPDLIKTYG